MKRVVVVGCGLIGGSIIQALRRSADELSIVGVDDDRILERAVSTGLLDQGHGLDQLGSPREVAEGADLVILALPVSAILAALPQWLAAAVPVTDTGSTKRAVLLQARRQIHSDWFVPGHPMAGRAEQGFLAARADLFQGRSWLVCPEGCRQDAVAAVDDLIRAVGARRHDVSAEEHDRLVAVTSHVPQLLASWLATAGAERQAMHAAGPAYADMTRIAGGSERMWKDILATNAAPIAEVLADGIRTLAAIAEELGEQPPKLEAALDLLALARSARNR